MMDNSTVLSKQKKLLDEIEMLSKKKHSSKA